MSRGAWMPALRSRLTHLLLGAVGASRMWRRHICPPGAHCSKGDLRPGVPGVERTHLLAWRARTTVAPTPGQSRELLGSLISCPEDARGEVGRQVLLIRHLGDVKARHVSLIVQRVGQMPEGARLADGTRASERSRRRAGSSGSKRSGANGARSTCRAAPSRISSLIASPVAGALSMPQTLWPVATKAPSTPGTAPMKGRPSSVTGRKHACHALIGAAASAGEIFRHSASSRACAPASAATSAGSTGIGPTVEITHTHVVPSARK